MKLPILNTCDECHDLTHLEHDTKILVCWAKKGSNWIINRVGDRDVTPPDWCPKRARMPATAYVVVGTCGEYSDRQEWVARVFVTRAAADAFVELLTREWAQCIAAANLDEATDHWAAMQKVREGFAALDASVPEYAYQEPKWNVQEAPFGPLPKTKEEGPYR